MARVKFVLFVLYGLLCPKCGKVDLDGDEWYVVRTETNRYYITLKNEGSEYSIDEEFAKSLGCDECISYHQHYNENDEWVEDVEVFADPYDLVVKITVDVEGNIDIEPVGNYFKENKNEFEKVKEKAIESAKKEIELYFEN